MRISDMMLSSKGRHMPYFWMIDTPDDRAMGIIMYQSDFRKFKSKLGRYGMIIVQKLLCRSIGTSFELEAMSVRIIEDEDIG